MIFTVTIWFQNPDGHFNIIQIFNQLGNYLLELFHDFYPQLNFLYFTANCISKEVKSDSPLFKCNNMSQCSMTQIFFSLISSCVTYLPCMQHYSSCLIWLSRKGYQVIGIQVLSLHFKEMDLRWGPYLLSLFELIHRALNLGRNVQFYY